MHVQHLQIAHPAVLSDPEWIALESIEEQTQHFIFDDTMLLALQDRGLVESDGIVWRVTQTGHRRLIEAIEPPAEGRVPFRIIIVDHHALLQAGFSTALEKLRRRRHVWAWSYPGLVSQLGSAFR